MFFKLSWSFHRSLDDTLSEPEQRTDDPVNVSLCFSPNVIDLSLDCSDCIQDSRATTAQDMHKETSNATIGRDERKP